MKTHKATITRNGDKASLMLTINDKQHEIVLTEDKPNEIKAVFNKLLEHLKSEEFQFALEDSKEDLHQYICKEYINQLNSEIRTIYNEMKDYGLTETHKV